MGRDEPRSSGSSQGQDAPRPSEDSDAGSVPLVKVLARAGLGPRRTIRSMVTSGRVSIDGLVTVDPLTRLDPRRAHVVVDGVDEVTVRAPEYLVLHKPPGVVATMHDPGGRRCLSDLLGAEHRGLFHVGRLQADAAGVQILMSDGELAHRLTAGKKHLPHSYLVRIAGPTPPDLLARLRAGVPLDGEAVAVDGCRVVVNSASTSVLEVTLRHRDAHGARRLLTAAGHSVLQVVCTQIGPVVLGSLEPGAFRPLTSDEVRRLEALGRQELSE